jgi:glyoxylase-like metal-dependent hydrolase (beta-lactamase superfamily II)
MSATVKQLELGPMANFTYIICDAISKQCACIDPGWEADKIISETKGLTISHILLTHAHFDHSNNASTLAKKTGAKIYVHRNEASKGAETFVDDDKIMIGNICITCIHTPGHTEGSTCFLLDEMIFTGDTLFVDGIGRTDLEGSDPEKMFKSLQKLAKLPDGTVIYPGHNYGNEPASTIGEQKKRNHYMQFKNAGDFLRL